MRPQRSALRVSSIEQVGRNRQSALERGQNVQLVGEIARHQRVGPGDPAGTNGNACLFRDRRHNLCAEPATLVVLVDHDQFPGFLDRFEHQFLVPRRQRAQINDFGFDARRCQSAGHLRAERGGVAPADES